MKFKTFFLNAVSLSLSLTLVACAGLPTFGTNPESNPFGSLFSKLNPQQSAIASAIVSDALYAIQSDNALDVANVLADNVMTTQSLASDMLRGHPGDRGLAKRGDGDHEHHVPPQLDASASMKASASIRVKEDKFKSRAKQLLAKKKGEAGRGTREEIRNSDGTKTAKMGMEMGRKNGKETHSINRTFDADGNLVEVQSHMDRTNPKGHKIVIDRDRVLNADGSWTTSFAMTVTRPDGKTKTVSWTRTENADGTQTGTGTLTRFDGTTQTMTLTKEAEGKIVTKVEDFQTKVAAEVTQGDGATDATVQISSDGKVAGTTSVTDTESVEPSEN